MLPVHIICHADCEPSAYLCDFFDRQNIPYKKTNALKNDLSLLDITACSALVFMGGPYSVNDVHEWLDIELQLIHKAIARNLPMMGVCLGAQIVSKALGAIVYRADHMETGWHQIAVDRSRLKHLPPLALDDSIEVFEWHEDVFLIPPGAIPIFSGDNHENQGYLMGNILVMQFHLEMTEHMVFEWLERYQDCIPEPSQSVQSPEHITARLHERLDNLHRQADTIYSWWLQISKNTGE